jgi:hypothetical protein
LDLDGLTVLDNVALARKLTEMGERGPVSLPKLIELTPECARELAMSQQDLDLDSLATLSPETAKNLVEFKGRGLRLDGLHTLSDESAKVLARFKGERLSLNGLKTISDTAASMLRTNPYVSFPRR